MFVSIADVIESTATAGEVRVRIGSKVDGTSFAYDQPVWNPDGFLSMPNLSDQDGTARAFYIEDGNQKHVIGFGDNRYAPHVGAMQPGDRMIVSKGAERFLMKDKDETIAIFTERQSDGTAMMVAANGKTGAINASVGLTQVRVEEKKIIIAINGGPSIVLDGIANKITMSANSIHIDGGFTTVGSPGGARPIAPGAQSALVGPTGLSGVPSASVLIAP